MQNRVLLMPPTSRDAEAICKLLAHHQMECEICTSIQTLCDGIDRGAGAVVISEEAITNEDDCLIRRIADQPVWSDLPILVLSRSGVEGPQLAAALARLGNVSVLERPVRTSTLISVVRSALRARKREYQVRDYITDRVRTEAIISHNREQMQLVVKGANVGVWMCPLPFDVLIWDETVRQHFHLDPDTEVTIDLFYERLHPEDRDRVRAAIEASVSRREPYDIDYRTVSPDGLHTKWIRASGRGFYDADGKPTGFDGITIDVTERIRADEELRESEQRLKLAVQTGKLGIWELDLRGQHVTCSPTCKASFGRDSNAPFTYAEVWDSIHPEDVPQVKSAIEESISSGQEFEIELRNIWPDGSIHWILARGRPTVASSTTPLRLVGVTLDITDRKSAEESRNALLEAERFARNEAERAGRMKDEFLATLSHELRTPLNAILGWAQLLKLGVPSAHDVAEGMNVIERNARAQAQIIEDLLDMNRIISGKIRLEIQRLDLAATVKAAIETVQPAAYARDIRLIADIDPFVASISGDPNRLQQVFWNLLSNAVKFTPKGGSVFANLRQVASHYEVNIIDTGDGISSEFMPHAFDRFRQADASTSRHHGGLGLGLAIVKQLVELHGGTVSATSGGEGKGATFTVSLPITATAITTDYTADPRRPAVVSNEQRGGVEPVIDGVKIVIIDDEPDARGILRRLLEERHAEVHVASTVNEAIALVEAERPDVLISDIGMPGEDGYSLIRRVRALPANRGGNTPAVALTAYARVEDRLAATRAGFQCHLAKPIAPSELFAAVSSLSTAASEV